MKLIHKTAFLIVGITVILFLIGGYFLAESLKSTIREEANADLVSESLMMRSLIELSPNLVNLKDRSVEFSPVDHNPLAIGAYSFADTTLTVDPQKGAESFRVITIYETAGSQLYQIKVFHPLVADQDLFGKIYTSLAQVSVVLTIAILLLVIFISKRLWRPFDKTLDRLESFDVRETDAVEFDDVSTIEFRRLNTQLSKMTQKASVSYHSLREYSENAAYELQTPLAIIQAKLAVLVQSDTLKPKEQEALNASLEAARRLSNLSQGMLLLMKMKNEQFGASSKCDLGKITRSHLKEVSELMEIRNIEFSISIQEPFEVDLPKFLAETLVSNLISNAIIHNATPGQLDITISKECLTIKNLGAKKALDSDQIYKRFNKEKEQRGNIGLGLAIVKQICKQANLDIEYGYADGGMHSFTMRRK